MEIFRKGQKYILRHWLAYDKKFVLVPECRAHVDRSLYQNNSDMATNGEIPFLKEYLASITDGVTFDVGANIGDWTTRVLELHDRLSVHCFEPHPATFATLKANLEGNPRVTLHNHGLSSAPGTATLFNVEADSGMSSLFRRDSVISSLGLKENPSVQISLQTLDSICEQLAIKEIALLKIDTEGNEPEVLAGGKRVLSTGKVRAIQFEYGGTWIDSRKFLVDVWNMLSALGYRLFKIAPSGLVPFDQYSYQFENFQYCNYVALAEGVTAPVLHH